MIADTRIERTRVSKVPIHVHVSAIKTLDSDSKLESQTRVWNLGHVSEYCPCVRMKSVRIINSYDMKK